MKTPCDIYLLMLTDEEVELLQQYWLDLANGVTQPGTFLHTYKGPCVDNRTDEEIANDKDTAIKRLTYFDQETDTDLVKTIK